jgi:copper chaperone CopZ
MNWLLAIALLVASLLGGVASLAQDGAQRTSVFRVEGMTCALCSKAIDKALRDVGGVRSVQVDRKAEQVTVVADAALTPDRLEQSIEGAGPYRAEFQANQ